MKKLAVDARPTIKDAGEVRRRVTRKLWRLLLLIFFFPFIYPDIITQVIPAVPTTIIKFVSGALILFPLGTAVEYVTEDFAERIAFRLKNKRAGESIGGFIHDVCTSGAYIAVSIFTLHAAVGLKQTQQTELVTVVQLSIAGIIVVNVLFNTGLAIILGSMKHGRINFSKEYAMSFSELLFISVAVLALPTLAYRLHLSAGLFNSTQFTITQDEAAQLSDITAVILLFTYFCYFGWTILRLGDRQGETSEEGLQLGLLHLHRRVARLLRKTHPQPHDKELTEYVEAIEELTAKHHPDFAGEGATGDDVGELALALRLNEEFAEGLKPPRARSWPERLAEFVVLIVSIALIVIVSEGMASGIEQGLLRDLNLNAFLVGIVILPITTGLVELSAAITHARHNEMDSALAVTTGTAIQGAMLVAPALVLVGHLFNLSSMNLIYGLFVLAIFGVITYLFQIITVDGETTWFEGAQLLSVFAAVAAVAGFAGPNM